MKNTNKTTEVETMDAKELKIKYDLTTAEAKNLNEMIDSTMGISPLCIDGQPRTITCTSITIARALCGKGLAENLGGYGCKGSIKCVAICEEVNA